MSDDYNDFGAFDDFGYDDAPSNSGGGGFWADYMAIKNEPNQARKITMAKQYEARHGKTISSLDAGNLGGKSHRQVGQ